MDYNFEVQTSDRFNAGTSANVWVNLMGTQASTGELCIARMHHMCIICMHHQNRSLPISHLPTNFLAPTMHTLVNSNTRILTTGRQPLDSKAHVEGASTGSKGTLPAFCSPSEVCRPRSVAFNRNGRGSFVLRQLPDVGIMKALEIGHDNSGISPGRALGLLFIRVLWGSGRWGCAGFDASVPAIPADRLG